MEVTDVLRDRTHEPGGLQRMLVASALLHAGLLLLIALAPDAWIPSRRAEDRSVMTITLGGGTPGPETGGMTQIGGRAIQAEPLPEPPPRREPVRPPAPRPPEMTVPAPQAAPAARTPPPAPPVSQAPPEARGRTPSRGEDVSPGSSVAETGARGQGFGLSTGGGGGGGTGARLDVADFCCPEYIQFMVERVRSNWDAKAEVPGRVEVKVVIQRNGRLTDVQVERSSGYLALDMNAQRAVVSTAQLPELPAGYTNTTLTVYLTFEYTR